ncbi:signal-transducing adaptor protein 2 isoform X2 [Microcebus murinus]|uniref:signal-transducing adaptor protein 2 isoform X2 n=1 Tax=Microcebus murinus TaxID=30608 RepID=UPI003F6A7CD2
MASALHPPRAPKPRSALRSHYYESFLEKKGPCDPDYKKFWAGLQGLTIYFYNSNRDFQHVEKLNLGTYVKLRDEAPRGSSWDPGTYFSLVLSNQEIKFKAESLESREMWKGFIFTVVERRVPANLTLLPGHLYMMAEALAKEEARRALETPSCFLKVSRLEAQLLLERNPENGNLLLRPSGDGTDGVSVTTRQRLNGAYVFRHYKVKREGAKFVIDLEEPFSCSSLDEVVNYFVTHTNRALVPLLPDEDYEKVLGPAPATGSPKLPPPESLPLSSQNKVPLLPPLPPLPGQEEDYVTPIGDAPAAEYENQDVPSPSGPIIPKPKLAKVQAKLPRPSTAPKPDLKLLNSGLTRKPAASEAQPFSATAGLAEVTAELQEKLQRRRALEY